MQNLGYLNEQSFTENLQQDGILTSDQGNIKRSELFPG